VSLLVVSLLPVRHVERTCCVRKGRLHPGYDID